MKNKWSEEKKEYTKIYDGTKKKNVTEEPEYFSRVRTRSEAELLTKLQEVNDHFWYERLFSGYKSPKEEDIPIEKVETEPGQ